MLLIVFSGVANAGAWADRRSQLDNVAVYDRFRIFYSLSGKDALPEKRQIDQNRNGIPDFIDEVARRFLKADKFFRNEVELTPPLKSKRYIGQVHYIDVNILNFSLNKKGPKNGVAYDGTPKFNRAISGQASLNVLAIDLSGSVRLKSNSVEHELFHLYQNGYSYFKNRWYTEGTARWSELVINSHVGVGGQLPSSTAQKLELFSKTYDANRFWNELILRSDKSKHGRVFIKTLLEQLDYVDDIAARDRGIASVNWKESEQKSKHNNPYIWRAVIESLKRMGYSFSGDNEVSNLLRI